MTKQDLRELIWELPDLNLANPEDREILLTVFEPLTKGFFQDAIIIPQVSAGGQVDRILKVVHLMAGLIETAYSEGRVKYLYEEESEVFSTACKTALYTVLDIPEDSLE